MLTPFSPPTPPLGISFLLSQPPFLFSFYLFIFWTYQVACRFLVPQQRIEPMPPLVEVQSLNHWTTREGPHPPFVNIQTLCQDMSASSYSFISLQVNLLCHHQWGYPESALWLCIIFASNLPCDCWQVTFLTWASACPSVEWMSRPDSFWESSQLQHFMTSWFHGYTLSWN